MLSRNLISGGFIIFSVLFFSIVVVLLVICIIKAIRQEKQNNLMPIREVQATVVLKRIRKSAGISHWRMPSKSYIVMFDFEDKKGCEFHVSREEYEKRYKGETGILACQGSRYIRFNEI